MKNVSIVVLGLGLLVLAACKTTPYAQPPEERREANAAMVTDLSEQAVRNAVIEQHTLLPRHFVNGTAQLTPLGERDLQFLADAYRTSGGTVNVVSAGAPELLYRQRIDAVLIFLEERGISRGSLVLADRPAGGRGATTARVVEIQKECAAQRAKGTTASAD
jgi:hypothetical protein